MRWGSSIEHVAIAVKEMDKALRFWETMLGVQCSSREMIPEQGVTVAFLSLKDAEIELLEATDPDSPVAKFIEKKGEGIHHIAIQVDDIEEAMSAARMNGFDLVDEHPRSGANGSLVAFVHPRSSCGVMLEFCQHRD